MIEKMNRHIGGNDVSKRMRRAKPAVSESDLLALLVNIFANYLRKMVRTNFAVVDAGVKLTR
jgi:hypothetical protein